MWANRGCGRQAKYDLFGCLAAMRYMRQLPLWQRHTPMAAPYPYGSAIPLWQRHTPMAAHLS
jgi:hypothetical protein